MSRRIALPPQSDLVSALDYRESDGTLWWNKRNDPQFNGQFAGRQAFTYSAGRHFEGHVLGVHCLAHRVIWKMVYGEEPAEIDHINGNGLDNRLPNLRSVTHQENSRNIRRSRRNTSGAIGVSFLKRTKRWRAYISISGKQIHLGYFDDRDAAFHAREQASMLHGFHQNHGSDVEMMQFLPKVRSAKIMRSAQNQPCSLRLPAICNHNPETTVFAHLPGIGKGVGTKVSDLHGAYACSACHSAIDNHTYEKIGLTSAIVLDAMLRGLCETQSRLIGAGIIEVKDGKIV